MEPPAIPDELKERIDGHLSRSEVFVAVSILMNGAGWPIFEAKWAIATRFRERFPDLFLAYRNLGDDDYRPA